MKNKGTIISLITFIISIIMTIIYCSILHIEEMTCYKNHESTMESGFGVIRFNYTPSTTHTLIVVIISILCIAIIVIILYSLIRSIIKKSINLELILITVLTIIIIVFNMYLVATDYIYKNEAQKSSINIICPTDDESIFNKNIVNK